MSARADLLPGVLSGIRVIDMAQGRAGALCAQLLAEAGAEVVRVEPAAGDPTRGTVAFASWNRSKAAAAIDWRGEGRPALAALLAGADVLIHDLPPADALRHGLNAAALAVTAPALSLCTIGSYPEGHADEAMPHDDFLVLASAGILDEQQPARRDGPVYLAFPLASCGATWLATIGIAARLYAMGGGGHPGPVATSLLQGGLAQVMTHWRLAETPSPSLAAGWPKTFRNSVFECADGVWVHVMAAPEKVPLMRAELDRMGPERVAELNQAMGFEHLLFPNLGANIEAFLAHPSGAWLEALWAADISVQPAMELGQIYQDAQAREMGYVAEIDDPDLGPLLQPGPIVGLVPPMAIKGPAPRAGGAAPGWPQRPAPSGAPPAAKPLAGLRVIDFGQHLAGPFATMLMADLGAEVIKIESLEGDAMRPFEWAFIGCQRGKRALALNLKLPDARAIVHDLVREADVVLHNLRLPAAERLGIDYATLSAINPRLIYTHCSAYGSHGPRKDWPGYDQLFQALSGWESACSGEGNRPDWLRYGMMDHQCAMSAAYGTLLALIARRTTGAGQLVTASILGASIMTTSGVVIVRPDGSIGEGPPVDALQTGVGPGRRLYACADGWLALVADDIQLAGLGPDLEALFAADTVDVGLRLAHAAGASAAPARTGVSEAFLSDRRNAELGLAASYPHPRYGRLTQPGALVSMDGLPMVSDLAPPLLGQHTRAILAEAGYDAATVDRLGNEGVVVEAA